MISAIVFHEEAEIEYRESFIWYELRLEGLGERFRQAVNETIKKIELNPEIYEKKRRGFREAPVSGIPFKIVYYILQKENTVFISSVFHTSRSPRKKYRRKRE